MKPPAYAVWLYGSHARGVVDSCSDLDILIATDTLTSIEEIQSNVPLKLNDASLTVYSWNEIKLMAEYGSLFLQHLKLEAVPLYESPSHRGVLRRLLGKMPDYKLARRDIRGFRVVLEDVAEALSDGGQKEYELSVLATVIRHSSILGCWLLNQPSFGRLEPVSCFISSQNIESVVGSEFPILYDYRLYADGRVERGCLQQVSANGWLKGASDVVESVEELTRERN